MYTRKKEKKIEHAGKADENMFSLSLSLSLALSLSLYTCKKITRKITRKKK